METSLTQSEGLIYFQNLVPGTKDSPFIDRYKSEVLDNDPVDDLNTERRQLLNEFPPVLSFYENEKKKFYEKEAGSCMSFCCGGVARISSLNGDVDMQKQDHYMVSTGSGTLYEGSAGDIKTQMQEDTHKQTFGSTEQAHILNGLKQFESIVTQRDDPNAAVKSNAFELAPEEKSYNPFVTKPDPTNT
jgi:hypothetical protein